MNVCNRIAVSHVTTIFVAWSYVSDMTRQILIYLPCISVHQKEKSSVFKVTKVVLRLSVII